MSKEIRSYQCLDISLRADDGEPKKIVGHASVFNEEIDLGWFREIVRPGAFKNSIKEDDVRALFNHDSNYVIGRNINGTLSMKEDDKGLAVEIVPPDTQWARDLMTSIERRDITQMSFAFEVVKEMWTSEDDKKDLRELVEVKLWDVSPVTYPAYDGTDVGVRSHEAWKEEQKRQQPPPEETVIDEAWKIELQRKRLELKLK